MKRPMISIKKIKELPFTRDHTPLYSSPSLNLAKIKGGDVYNKVPDACLLSLDIRYLPTQTMEDIIAQIESVTGKNVHLNMYSKPVKTERVRPIHHSAPTDYRKETPSKTLSFSDNMAPQIPSFLRHMISQRLNSDQKARTGMEIGSASILNQ
ncbi:peptidase dimerization domain-containing protein [Peribacillus frigoritolerans]|nr:peptidase dimerization domain-containing protein [Peribacillus frigoritolerans]